MPHDHRHADLMHIMLMLIITRPFAFNVNLARDVCVVRCFVFTLAASAKQNTL